MSLGRISQNKMFRIGGSLTIFVIFISNSVTGSGLHGSCEKHEQCGIFDTFCTNGTCACREGFAEIFDTCIQFAVPSIRCTHKTECRPILGGRSICKDGQCACKSFHHLHEGQCIKSRGLDEICEYDHQCYCGRNCHGIECVHRLCRCKYGHNQIGRRCISMNRKEEFLVQQQISSSKQHNLPISLIFILFYTVVLYNFR